MYSRWVSEMVTNAVRSSRREMGIDCVVCQVLVWG